MGCAWARPMKKGTPHRHRPPIGTQNGSLSRVLRTPLSSPILEQDPGKALTRAIPYHWPCSRIPVHFSRRVAGVYEATVHMGEQRLMPPLACEVRPAPALAVHTVCEGGGLSEAVSGKEARFTLLAHDAYGNQRSRGGDTFCGWLTLRGAATSSQEATALVTRSSLTGIEQPGRVKVVIADLGDGSYQCAYTGRQPGCYALHIEVNGALVDGAPFDVQVLPAYLEPSASSASGLGLKMATAGETAVFHLTPRDPRGQTISTIEQLRSIRVRVVHHDTSAHAAVWLMAGHDNALDIHYRSMHAGAHDVWVLLHGNPLPGCPHHVTVRPASVCPNACTISGLQRTSPLPPVYPQHHGPHGVLHGPLADAASGGGASADGPWSVPGGRWDGVPSGGWDAAGGAADGAAGAVGGYGSPAPLVPPAVPPGEYQMCAGEAAIIKLTTSDVWGNARPPCTSHLSAVLCRESDRQQTAVAISRVSPQHAASRHAALFQLEWMALLAGWHELLCHDSTGSVAARARVHVRPGRAVSCQLVAGTNLTGSALVAGQWVAFDMEASDACGNGLSEPVDLSTTGAHQVPTVVCSSCVPSHPPRVVQTSSGSWEVQLMPAISGSHELHISIGPTAAVGSPFTVDVRPGLVQGRRCTVVGLDGTAPFLPSNFTIEARDAFGNRCLRGGHHFSISIAPKGHGHYGKVEEIIDHDTGEYTVRYSTQCSGKYAVSVMLSRVAIEGSPLPLLSYQEDDPAMVSPVRKALAAAGGRQAASGRVVTYTATPGSPGGSGVSSRRLAGGGSPATPRLHSPRLQTRNHSPRVQSPRGPSSRVQGTGYSVHSPRGPSSAREERFGSAARPPSPRPLSLAPSHPSTSTYAHASQPDATARSATLHRSVSSPEVHAPSTISRLSQMRVSSDAISQSLSQMPHHQPQNRQQQQHSYGPAASALTGAINHSGTYSDWVERSSYPPPPRAVSPYRSLRSRDGSASERDGEHGQWRVVRPALSRTVQDVPAHYWSQ